MGRPSRRARRHGRWKARSRGDARRHPRFGARPVGQPWAARLRPALRARDDARRLTPREAGCPRTPAGRDAVARRGLRRLPGALPALGARHSLCIHSHRGKAATMQPSLPVRRTRCARAAARHPRLDLSPARIRDRGGGACLPDGTPRGALSERSATLPRHARHLRETRARVTEAIRAASPRLP